VRLLSKQDGRCTLRGEDLLTVEDPPQTPQGWEWWYLWVAKKAIAADYLVHHDRIGAMSVSGPAVSAPQRPPASMRKDRSLGSSLPNREIWQPGTRGNNLAAGHRDRSIPSAPAADGRDRAVRSVDRTGMGAP
jgi:hypothetical protein